MSWCLTKLPWTTGDSTLIVSSLEDEDDESRVHNVSCGGTKEFPEITFNPSHRYSYAEWSQTWSSRRVKR